MESISSDQLRAARMLLHLSQAELAKKAEVGIATVQRLELGQEIRSPQIQAIARVLREAGILIIPGGTYIGDTEVEVGVALVRDRRKADPT